MRNMSDEKKLTIALWTAVSVVLVLGIVLVALMVSAVQRTSEAVRYDLDCVTEMNDSPLKECKDE